MVTVAVARFGLQNGADSEPVMRLKDIEDATLEMSPNYQMQTFDGISVPELAIMISMKKLGQSLARCHHLYSGRCNPTVRVAEDRGFKNYNFQMVFETYRKFITSSDGSSINVYSKVVMFKVASTTPSPCSALLIHVRTTAGV